jgi:hypothetical protein
VQRRLHGPVRDEGALAADALQVALVDQLPEGFTHGDPGDAVLGDELAFGRDRGTGSQASRDEVEQDAPQLLVLRFGTLGDAARHASLVLRCWSWAVVMRGHDQFPSQ